MRRRQEIPYTTDLRLAILVELVTRLPPIRDAVSDVPFQGAMAVSPPWLSDVVTRLASRVLTAIT